MREGRDNAVSRLRENAAQLYLTDSDRLPASAQKWEQNARRLAEHILRDEPSQFCSWDVIRETMFASNIGHARTELAYLQKKIDWNKGWKRSLVESRVGAPERYVGYRKSSTNLIHHCYHLAVFQEVTARSVPSFDCVIEFGGGYGSMCRLISNLAFQGRYIICDLPIFSALQEYYLSSLNLTVRRPRRGDALNAGISLLSDVAHLSSLMSDLRDSKTLFIATWSLSEIPLAARKEISEVARNSSAFLIAYQKDFMEIDNSLFFESWREKSSSGKSIVNFEIEHMPGNYYFIGVDEKG